MTGTALNQYEPKNVTPPGATLEDLLAERSMTPAELADRMQQPRKTINEIIKGWAGITSETALQLEHVLGVSATFWLNRECLYRASIARQARTRRR
jgi:HTH-type transcriptional regulator / antitoxin HigA